MKKIDCEPVMIGGKEYVLVENIITKETNCWRCAAFESAFLCSRLETAIPGFCGTTRFWLTLAQYGAERLQGNIEGLNKN